ncbi:ribonuclease H-like domain-containing protein [Tanacetum coccineum]
MSAIKLPILKKGEYDIWAMKMEHFLSHTDYPLWEVIQKGNGPVKITTDTNGVMKVLPPQTAEETLARERERKARTTLLLALPEDHLAKFHKMTNAKEMWEAIKSRFSGNDESKKMQKYILKQQFEGFTISNSEGLHKGYDRFQSLLSQLEIHGAGVSTEDANQKFLRALPSAWSQVSLVMRTKSGVDSLNFDDLYNNLRAFESDVKGFIGSSSSTQNVVFVSSESIDSTNDVSTAYVAMISMRLKKFHNKSGRKIQFDAKEPVGFDKTKRKDAWNSGYKTKDNGRRPGKQEESNALITLDGEGIDWTAHAKDEEDHFALMAFSNSGSDSEAYTEALKKVEAQLVAYQQNQLWYEEKIRFMKVDLDDKTDELTYHKKLLAEALKEKEELKTKFENWQNSSKNLGKLLNTQMSANDKFGLGYGDHRYGSILSYENEVLQSVFMNEESDLENLPLYDRFVTEGMHAVPPPMIGNYMPSGPNIEIDYSKFTYGPKQSKTNESETQTSDFDTRESNSSIEILEFVPEPVVNEPNVVSRPKVWSDAPIIEEYESDSDDDCVSTPLKEQEQPSFAFDNTTKHVKTPKEPTKEQHIYSKSPKVDKKGLGYGFTMKACFVCGSFSHLIRDCDFHEKRMAKQAELNKRVCKGTGLRENRPVWNNVQRVNHQNQFFPTTVLTRTGKIPVNTARQNFLKQAVPRKVNTAKRNFVSMSPKMNENDAYKRQNVFKRFHSPVKRPFQNKTVTTNMIWKPMANTSNVNHVNTVGSQVVVNTAKGYQGNVDNLHKALKNIGIVDSGCSRHMTGNKAYLVDYQDYNEGHIAFGGSKGYITSKDTECLVLSPKFKFPDENQVLLRIHRQNNMYSFNLENIVPNGGLTCLIAKATIDESNMWHRRLGHVNFKNLNKLVKENLVRGLPSKVTAQAAEIKALKAQIKQLKKKARPHHKAWFRAVRLKKQQKGMDKSKKRRSVSKQGRKAVKSSKGAPSVTTHPDWDYLEETLDEAMDYTLAQDEEKTDKVDKKGENERKIKEMNEGTGDPDKKRLKKKFVKEDHTAKVLAKQDVTEQGTKKRKGGHINMIARKKSRPQPDVDSDDEHRKCLRIVALDSTIDSEVMETKSVIARLNKVSSPDGNYLVIYRANGNFRAFNYL